MSMQIHPRCYKPDDENIARRNPGAAARERSFGRTMSNILRRVCRVPLVQHNMSMMKKAPLAGIAALLLSTGTAHTCELEAKILEDDNLLHVLVKCADVEMLHKDRRTGRRTVRDMIKSPGRAREVSRAEPGRVGAHLWTNMRWAVAGIVMASKLSGQIESLRRVGRVGPSASQSIRGLQTGWF